VGDISEPPDEVDKRRGDEEREAEMGGGVAAGGSDEAAAGSIWLGRKTFSSEDDDDEDDEDEEADVDADIKLEVEPKDEEEEEEDNVGWCTEEDDEDDDVTGRRGGRWDLDPRRDIVEPLLSCDDKAEAEEDDRRSSLRSTDSEREAGSAVTP